MRGRGTAKHPGDAVIILDPNWVELVVVTANTAHRHSHEHRAEFTDLRVDVVRLHFALVGIHDFNIADHEEAGGDDVFRAVFN